MLRFIFLLGTAFALHADQLQPVTTTERIDVSPAPTIHIEKSIGSISVEAWDEPSVDLTVVKSAAERQVLDRVHVAMQRNGDGVSIRSEYPKRNIAGLRPDFTIEYRIKAPASAKLMIEHVAGDVNLRGMTDDIRASDGDGDILLEMPEGNHSIDAKSRIGSVISDFGGTGRRKHFVGHQFDGEAQTGGRLHLRVGFGDIVILKMRKPGAAGS